MHYKASELGLETVCLTHAHFVHATVLGNLAYNCMQAAKDQVAEIVGKSGVDYLINNAGTAGAALCNTHQE